MKKTIKITILLILSILILPIIIIGSCFMIIGRSLTALGFIFWFEPKSFIIEMQGLLCDIKTWYTY